MRQPKLIDYILLVILSLIWASAFFNIKIATESFGPITIAFLRVFFGSIPVLLLCFYKKIRVEAFSKDCSKFLRNFSALLTGSLSNKLIFQLIIDW